MTGSPTQKRIMGPKLELREHHKQQMRDAFDLLDADGTGTINVKDLKASRPPPRPAAALSPGP